MEFPNRLYSLRVNAKRSQTEVAEFLGISQPEYSRMEKGRRKIDAYVKQICDLFECKEPDVFSAAGATDQKKTAEYESTRCPVYGQITPDHRLIWTSEPVKWIEMPTSLKYIKDVYSVTNPGTTMEPKFSEGDILHCDPSRPPKVGDCVVYSAPNDNERKIALLKEITNDSYHFFTYGDQNTIKVNAENIDSIHTIRGVRFN